MGHESCELWSCYIVLVIYATHWKIRQLGPSWKPGRPLKEFLWNLQTNPAGTHFCCPLLAHIWTLVGTVSGFGTRADAIWVSRQRFGGLGLFRPNQIVIYGIWKLFRALGCLLCSWSSSGAAFNVSWGAINGASSAILFRWMVHSTNRQINVTLTNRSVKLTDYWSSQPLRFVLYVHANTVENSENT